jgi:predicted HTH domain antitoxin
VPSISARIPDDEAKRLEEVRSTTIRKALEEGLHELRVRKAIEHYQSGEASLHEAARIADVSLGEWFEIARERNLTTQLTPADLEADFDAVREP